MTFSQKPEDQQFQEVPKTTFFVFLLSSLIPLNFNYHQNWHWCRKLNYLYSCTSWLLQWSLLVFPGRKICQMYIYNNSWILSLGWLCFEPFANNYSKIASICKTSYSSRVDRSSANLVRSYMVKHAKMWLTVLLFPNLIWP